MTEYIKVKDKNNLLRDVNSNGIVNDDFESYNAYVQNYKKAYEQNNRLKTLENDVSGLRGDLSEIKILLRSLLNESK
jgi:hypothetical protein